MTSRRKISWILIAFGLFIGILYGSRVIQGGAVDLMGFLVFAVLPPGIGFFLRYGAHYYTVKPEVEKEILKLASEQENLLTAADVALHTSLSMEQSGNALEELRRKGHVRLKVADNGVLVYEFPAVLSREDKLNAERV